MAELNDKCGICGVELTIGKAWKLPRKLGEGYLPYCTSCMEKMYKYYAGLFGYRMALWFCCAMFNMPYRPDLMDEAKKYASKWGGFGGYVTALRAHGGDKDKKGYRRFEDGVTDIRKAFGGEYATMRISDEMLEDEDYLSGKLVQEQMWGTGPEDAPYSDEDYEQLNEYYGALADTRPGASDQTKQSMQKIARWTLEQERCFDKGDYANVEKLQKIIKDEKENEQLRKKDELPQDFARLDDIVQAVERAGLNIMNRDELLTALANHSFHKRYPYTRDAADQMLLSIRNSTAWNEGHAEVASLPPEYAIIDDLDEFAEKPDDAEKAIYKALQISPMNLKNPTEEEK